MKCSLCGGLVTWRGPLSDLTHTECERCGERNCQEPEWPEPDGSEHADGVDLPDRRQPQTFGAASSEHAKTLGTCPTCGFHGIWRGKSHCPAGVMGTLNDQQEGGA